MFVLTVPKYSAYAESIGPFQIPSFNPADWFNAFLEWIGQAWNALTQPVINFFAGAWLGQGIFYFTVKLPTTQDLPSMATVYETVKFISLILFVLVLFVAGISFGLESWGLMSEGTAMNMLRSSLFNLIMIFLILPLYDSVAGLLNYSSAFIINPSNPGDTSIINVLLQKMITPNLSDASGIASIFVIPVVLILIVIVLILIPILGIIRIFFTAAFITFFPILLLIRLIPFLRGFADKFINQSVGLILSGLLAAIFLKFGIDFVQNPGEFPVGGIWLASFATLIAAALMPVVLAPMVGTVFQTAAQAGMVATAGGAIVAGGAISGGVAGSLGAMRGLGGVAGMAQDFKPKGGGMAGRVAGMAHGLRTFGGTVGAQTLVGFAKGYGRGSISMLSGMKPGMGRLGLTFIPIRSARNLTTTFTEVEKKAADVPSSRMAEATIVAFAVQDKLGGTAKVGRTFQEQVANMDAKQVVDIFGGAFGSKDTLSQERLAKTVKDQIASLTPPQAGNVKMGIDAIQRSGRPLSSVGLHNALRNYSTNKRMLQTESVQPSGWDVGSTGESLKADVDFSTVTKPSPAEETAVEESGRTGQEGPVTPTHPPVTMIDQFERHPIDYEALKRMSEEEVLKLTYSQKRGYFRQLSALHDEVSKLDQNDPRLQDINATFNRFKALKKRMSTEKRW